MMRMPAAVPAADPCVLTPGRVPQRPNGVPDDAPVPGLDGVTWAELHELLRMPPDRFFRVNGLSAIGPGATGSAQAIRFTEEGYVIGVTAVPRGDGTAAGFASLAIQLIVGQEQSAFTSNGEAADFVVIAAMVGTNPVGFCPIIRKVYRNDTWSVQGRNYHAANTYTPEVTFAFKRWDCRRS
jgi:hypothetical protein